MLGNKSQNCTVISDNAGQKESQVDSQLNHLNNECGRLHERLDTLVARLDTVLDKSSAKEQEQPCAPETVLVTLASRIRRNKNSIENAVEKLDLILRYLEI